MDTRGFAAGALSYFNYSVSPLPLSPSSSSLGDTKCTPHFQRRFIFSFFFFFLLTEIPPAAAPQNGVGARGNKTEQNGNPTSTPAKQEEDEEKRRDRGSDSRSSV